MGYYDKVSALAVGEGVWFTPDRYDFRDCYNASEAFEQGIFTTAGQPVGKVLPGFTTFPPQHLKPFGLEYHVRRIGDPAAIQAKKIARRQADARKREAAKKNRSVITLTFDRNWNLTGKTIETRLVYTNTKGQRIKTRSEGSPRVHEIDGKFVVVYYPQRFFKYGGEHGYRLGYAEKIPDECPVLDNI